MEFLTYTAITFAALWALWYLYLIVMGLYRAHLQGRLSKAAKILGAPALFIAVVLDWLVNLTIATVWFMELPGQPLELLTTRLARYLDGHDNLNRRHAAWICANLLDVFDPSPNGHCQ